MENPAIELGLQELEAMDAPGWGTALGVVAGVAATSAAGAGGYVAYTVFVASSIT